MIRTGIGYDVHPLESGEPLIIGGIEIPSEKGSVGHSDGDVLCHALVDALLGAGNLGDIGQYFPSDDETWKGVSSLEFLKSAAQEVRGKGFEILNVDSTVLLQEPKIGLHLPDMKARISGVLSMSEENVSVKATTTDFLGFVGRGEGIAALAVACVSRSE